MKRLIITLFVFVAVFVVAGSASAVVYSDEGFVKHFSDVYDETNGYTVSAVVTVDNDIDIIVEEASGEVAFTEILSVSGSDSLLGVAYKTGTDNVYIGYVSGTETVSLVEFDFKSGTGSEGTIVGSETVFSGNQLGPYIMSKGLDSTTLTPYFLSFDGLVTDTLIWWKNSGTWINFAVLPSHDVVADLYATGSDRNIHMLYQGSSDDIYSKAYTVLGGSVTTFYTPKIIDNNQSGAIQSIVATGLSSNDYVEGAWQRSDNSIEYAFYEDVIEEDYLTSLLSVGSVNANQIFDAVNAEDNNTDLYYYSVNGDSNDLEKMEFSKSTGNLIGSAIAITSTNTDYITSIDAAGFNTSDQPISTFVFSDASIYDALDVSTNGGSPATLFQEQGEGGSSVPELPGSTIWKILIVVLALGLVVGITAFMRKKKK